MQLQIIQKGQVLRTINHEGQTYVETPLSGAYSLRVYNTCHRRRLVLLSVDGINVINGKEASAVSGAGYVLEAYQTIEVPGYRRDDGTVASFEFREQGGSYAAQTGHGTTNVGVIGLAAFDEKVVVRVTPPHDFTWDYRGPWGSGSAQEYGCNSFGDVSRGGVISTSSSVVPPSDELCAVAAAAGPSTSTSWGERSDEPPLRAPNLQERLAKFKADKGVSLRSRSASVPDVGTAYGKEVSFHTMETTFTKATDQPVLILTLRYATRARLESWGVPVEKPNVGPMAANPFPASQPSVPAPPGWRG